MRLEASPTFFLWLQFSLLLLAGAISSISHGVIEKLLQSKDVFTVKNEMSKAW